MNIETAVNAFMGLLQHKVNEHYAQHYKHSTPPTYTVQAGRKFLKVVQNDKSGSRSVHAFIDKTTGDLLKPASWNAPAKGARYNLFTDLPTLEQRITSCGGYLYKGAV